MCRCRFSSLRSAGETMIFYHTPIKNFFTQINTANVIYTSFYTVVYTLVYFPVYVSAIKPHYAICGKWNLERLAKLRDDIRDCIAQIGGDIKRNNNLVNIQCFNVYQHLEVLSNPPTCQLNEQMLCSLETLSMMLSKL